MDIRKFVNVAPTGGKRHTFKIGDSQEAKQLVIKPEDSVNLTSSQISAFTAISEGKNIFLTGEAGTGKTFLINKVRQLANKQHINIAVTAMTGTAAYLLNGTTLHSWASIGLGRGSTEQLIEKIAKSAKARHKWRTTQILVIDEISMMLPEILDKLEEIGRRFANPDRPFGGIQVILIGDFLQLPPVPDSKDKESGGFAFQAKCWSSLIKQTVVLTEVIRQQDPVFRKCLSEIRVGRVSSETKQLLKARINMDLGNQEIMATRIYPYKYSVDTINKNSLVKLNAPLRKYQLTYSISIHGKKIPSESETGNYELKNILKHVPCEETLSLCLGAQVMLISNLDGEAGLVNGSRGVVIKIGENGPEVKFLNGIVREICQHEWVQNMEDGSVLTVKQYPLILAWAITVHKSQGASLDLAEIDVGSTIFAYGQAYVALSRVRSLEGLRLIAFDEKKVKANPTVLDFYHKMSPGN